MKKFQKVVGLMLAMAMCATAFAACGDEKKKSPNSTTDIEISYWKSGLGRAWLDNIIAGFEVKYPEYNVMLDPSEILVEANATLALNDSDTVDLYLSNLSYTGYEENYANLDDLLDSTYGEESKTIRQKFNPNVLEQLKRPDGSIYALSYGGGYCGICYNADIIDGVTYKVPKTTFELEVLTAELQGKDIVPYASFRSGGYAQYMEIVWQAQYDGLDYFNNNFLQLKDESGTSPSKNVMLKKDGRYQALLVMEKLFTPTTLINNVNSIDHTTAQTRFLNKGAAMMINGMWLINEMGYKGDANISMMKSPVISSIIDKCPSIGNDGELSALITDIDAATEGDKTITLTGDADTLVQGTGYSVTEADYQRIYEARNLMYNNAAELNVVIPKYSKAKEGATKFVQYMYSDEAIKTYFDTAHFSYQAYFSDESIQLDTSSWSGFEKTLFGYYETGIPVNSQTFSRNDVFRVAGVDGKAKLTFADKLVAKGSAKKTATQLWSDLENEVNKNWTNWLSDAGL